MNLVGWLVILVFGCYAGLCGLLFLKQRALLYYPTLPQSANGFTEMIPLENDGETLSIVHYPGESRRAVLYFGGNAENVALAGSALAEMLPGCELFLMNYRGYGGSSGNPSEAGLVSDGMALYDLAAGAGTRRISVIGRSLGTGVAIQVAARRPVEKLVLITPFDSMVRLASHYYPWVPVSLLLLDRYDSAAVADRLQLPVLAVLAGRDEVIPRKRSEALLALLEPNWLQTVVVDQAGHNDIEQYQDYQLALSGFLEENQGTDLGRP